MKRLANGTAAALFGLLILACGLAAGADDRPVVHRYWESYHVEDGLPSDHVFYVVLDGDRVWAATDNGVGCLENGEWTYYNVADGLAHRAVLGLAVDPRTRDVWCATMGGLTRISAGRLTSYTQFNSGLPNDVIFGVTVENQNVWVATTAGEGRFRVREKAWDIWTPDNCPQHEPWGYHIDYDGDKVWAALWGGGALEFDIATEHWKDYLDPDGEMEIDLFRDDGIIHVITTAVSYRAGILWASTYFGLSRYDGKHWRGYMDHDTGMCSNFINFVKATPDGRVAYVGTDKGLSSVNGETNRWVTYGPKQKDGSDGVAYWNPTDKWEVRIYDEAKLLERHDLESWPADNFVLSIDVQGDDIWLATAHGLSHGSVKPLSGERASLDTKGKSDD
jgi:ligand-binding sensor domain-containing protein